MRRVVAVGGRFLLGILALNLLFAAIAGAVCWFAGWRTGDLYGSALVVVGLIAMMIGLIGFTQLGDRDRGLEYARARIAMRVAGPETPLGNVAERAVLGVAGLVAMFVGGFIPSIW